MISMYASTVSMRVFIPSFIRCFSRPWRDSSHGMSSGVTTFLRFALRAGIASASSSSAWYSAWFAVPLFQAFDSPHAMFLSLSPRRRPGPNHSVVEIGLGLARPEGGGLGSCGGLRGAGLDLLLE